VSIIEIILKNSTRLENEKLSVNNIICETNINNKNETVTNIIKPSLGV
jgi:hypothetical protein